jgi:hypothetical protein
VSARVPSWLLKAGAQGAISILPWRRRLNRLFQERVTGNVQLTARRFESKVAQAERHLRHRSEAKPDSPLPRSALELGTGWHPVVPIALALSGVERIVTVDIDPLTDGDRAREALDLFASYLERDRLAAILPGVQAARARRLLDASRGLQRGDAQTLLAPLGIELEVTDARRTGLAPGSIDFFVSNNTLEHIPPDRLRALVTEFRRLAAPGAVMDHFIDMRDHYSSFDRSISRLNYLRYPEPVWRLFNNRLHYQNRLRVSDYRALVEAAGFTIVAEHRTRGKPHEFDDLALDRRYRDTPRSDLFTLFAWLTAVADG